jgi:hypothetical protein
VLKIWIGGREVGKKKLFLLLCGGEEDFLYI